MEKLRPFKEVQLQWLRLLLRDTELSARAFQFATYLAVWRYNHAKGKAWPSHGRVCEDLDLQSEKTIQRLIKELDGKWFDIKSGNGLGNATEYVPTKTSHLAAQRLRAEEERKKRAQGEDEKADNIVHLPISKGGHSCPEKRSKMSRQPRQKCLPKKDHQKIKEKDGGDSDLLAQDQFDRHPAGASHRKCPVNSLVVVHATDEEKVLAWNEWLAANGLPHLDQLSIGGQDAGGPGYLMPRRWVPSTMDDQGMIESYVLWAFERQQEVCQNA